MSYLWSLVFVRLLISLQNQIEAHYTVIFVNFFLILVLFPKYHSSLKSTCLELSLDFVYILTQQLMSFNWLSYLLKTERVLLF